MGNDTLAIKGRIRFENYRLGKAHRLAFRVLRFLKRHDLAAAYVRTYGTMKWDTGVVDNLITNAGKAQMALLAGDASAVPFTYLAVGTSSTAVAATDTTLGAELSTSGLGRAAATVSRTTTTVTNDTLSLTYTWTASGTVTVQEVGVFNAASTGTMLGHALTGSKGVVSTDILLGTYTVKFS